MERSQGQPKLPASKAQSRNLSASLSVPKPVLSPLRHPAYICFNNSQRCILCLSKGKRQTSILGYLLLKLWFSNLRKHQNPLEGCALLRPSPRNSGSVGVGGLGTCISHKSPSCDDTGASGSFGSAETWVMTDWRGWHPTETEGEALLSLHMH